MPTILVCESLRDNRAVIRDLLTKNASWTIAESDSPQNTFETLANQDVGVLLTDLNVPDVDGRPFLEALRERFPRIPTIVVTSAGLDKAVVRALVLGAASYIPRTALARDLRGTVERLLLLADPRPAWNRIRANWSGATTRFALPNDQSMAQDLVHHLQDELSRRELCGPDARTRIGMALTEAFANAIVHGNLEIPSSLREADPDAFARELATRPMIEPYRNRKVRLDAAIDPSGATFAIADDGAGFDVRNVPDPTDEANLLKVTGRGLLLMRAFTDRLTFNEAGNVVTMRVTFRSESRGDGRTA